MFKTLTLIFTFLLSLQVWAGPMVELQRKADLDSYMEHSGFNGVVLVAKDKTTLLKKAFGVKSFVTNKALSVDDKFQIGSVTKQFIAAAILKLEEEGRLSIEDGLTEYFPEQEQLKNIRIKNILNHTAGITNYTEHPEFWRGLRRENILTLDQMASFVFNFPLDFEVGSAWNYSNSGYILAGMIIEKITGQSWDQYIQYNLLTPLKMKNSGYKVFFEDVSDVVGHVQNKEGDQLAVNDFNLSWAQTAGGIYSTLDDLLKWSAIYDESPLLNSLSKKKMQTPFLSNYGLGLIIADYNGETLITHGGTTPGFSTKLHYLKESKLHVITFNNINGSGPNLGQLLLEFFRQGKASALKTKLIPMTKEKLAEYVGRYKSADFEFKVFMEDEKLYLFPTGQRPYLMQPVDIDSFNLEGFAGEEFLRDEQGKVHALKHFQNGETFIFNRMEIIEE